VRTRVEPGSGVFDVNEIAGENVRCAKTRARSGKERSFNPAVLVLLLI
jgi:hypothetical protein